MDIFKITNNDNFFSILNCPNKTLYWCIISDFYKNIIENPERRINRTEAKISIEEIAERNDITSIDANDIIKRFSDCGWINIQYDGIKGCDYIFFTQYAFHFIRFNHNYIQNNKSIKTSEILNTIMNIINEMLNPSNDNSEPHLFPYQQGLLRIKDLTNELINGLFEIIQKIESNINNILKIEDMQILINELIKYLEDVNSGYIAVMYKNSNITPLQEDKLIDLITSIKTDTKFQEKIIQDMKNSYSYANADISEESLFIELSDLLDMMQLLFCDKYQECRRKIDNLKADMSNRAVGKLQLLSSDRSSHVSKINYIIGLLETTENDNDLSEVINELFKIKTLTIVRPQSIFTPHSAIVTENPQPVISNEIDDKEFNDAFYNIPDNSKQANSFAMELLGDKKEIDIKAIDKENIDKIIVIASYSDYPDSKYNIEVLDEKIQIGNVLTNNFIIRRK